MKTAIKILPLCLLCIMSSSLLCCTSTQVQNATTPAALSADAGLALQVALAYEGVARDHKPAAADYASLAVTAANLYAATQPSATASQVQQWTGLALTLVRAYDLTKTGLARPAK